MPDANTLLAGADHLGNHAIFALDMAGGAPKPLVTKGSNEEAHFALERIIYARNALNAPSRAGALRLGFSFEGVFRQATVYKGRNRDTAWFSITDREWPALEPAFQRWLDPSNFDEHGTQRIRLSELTA